MKAWSVYLNGKKIDTVFFGNSVAQADVLLSLINHDGYDSMITVRRAALFRESND